VLPERIEINFGTTLKDESEPFTFYGFGWEYSETTIWDDGLLARSKVFVRLEYPGESIPLEHKVCQSMMRSKATLNWHKMKIR
jgi:hypothetical protein